ncbi:MAG: DNRLRE domain-containing protein [Bryobacteraceae bacterium]|jgi:TGF-beta propeptide
MKTKTNMHVRSPFARKCNLGAALMLVLLVATVAHAQLTPSGDAYTNTADPTTNYGAATTLDVKSASETAYIQFNLSSIPSGDTGADITQATLKLYVNAVTKAGSFNVDYVNGTWSEGTIDANNAPALGSTIAASVPLTTADKNQYILIDVTAAVQAWLNGSQANDGIALVGNSPLNASLDSKENTTTSHSAELDIVFAGGGTLTGITTASGSGLIGGGSSGTLSLSLTNACATNQVLQWNGTAWICAAVGTGTITGVTAGTDLTGGGTTGNVTLNLDTTKVPQLNTLNTFTAEQLISSGGGSPSLSVSNSGGAAGVYSIAAGAGIFGETTTNTVLGGVMGVDGSAAGTGTGVYGTSASGHGVYGTSGGGTGVFGNSTRGNGVYGVTEDASGVGVFGQNEVISATGAPFAGTGVGVWGDAGKGNGGSWGVLGTADNDAAGFFANNSPSGNTTLTASSDNSAAFPFVAQGTGGYCAVDSIGDLICSGSKNAVVPINGGARKVALAAIESPKNWFEDFGSAQLSGGAAVVALDPDFIETVNTEREYMVIPVPNGECKGLYVTKKTATSFEVRELGGGTSSIQFDYRIVALRRNYEDVRFADHTNDPDPSKMIEQIRIKKAAKPQTSASYKGPTPPNLVHESERATVSAAK